MRMDILHPSRTCRVWNSKQGSFVWQEAIPLRNRMSHGKMFLRSSKWRFCHVCHQTGVCGGVVMFRPNFFGAWPENLSLGDPNNPWFKCNNVTCTGGFVYSTNVIHPELTQSTTTLPKAKSENQSRIGGWNEILSFLQLGILFRSFQ